MSAMTNVFENLMVDHLFRTTAYARPTGLTVHLYTVTPGETGGGTEVTGGSYASVANNPSNSNWYGTHGTTTGASSGTGGATTNAVQLNFPTPTANWGTIAGSAIKDNLGNMMFYGALTTPKTVNNGDPAPYFAVSALGVTLA